DEEVFLDNVKSVPRNIQASEERRTGVIVSPARFAVGRTFVESAEMSPAIRVVGRGGLVAAKTLTAARGIQPNRNPIARWLVVQNNRIAKGIVEGALTVRFGETGESG